LPLFFFSKIPVQIGGALSFLPATLLLKKSKKPKKILSSNFKRAVPTNWILLPFFKPWKKLKTLV